MATSNLALSGVLSGINTESIIANLMALSKKPLTIAQDQKAALQDKKDAVAELERRVTQLRDLAKGLWDPTANRAVIATTSNAQVVSASTGSGAGEGSYSIEVHQMATAHKRIQLNGLSSATSTVGSSRSSATSVAAVDDAGAAWFTTGEAGATYTFDFGTESDLATVTFAANTSYTMNQVRDLINTRSQAVAGYDAASVVEDGGQYRLKLTAKDYGPVGAMAQTLTAGDAIAELGDDADWTKTDGQAGAFRYTYKGVTRTVNTAGGTTLSSLRDLINNDGANPGVTASLLYYDGTYHLVLSGSQTGADNTITIDDAATTLAGFDTADLVQTQAAQDAQFRVDGFPSGSWLSRSSNSVTDVIPNVTLSLQGAGTANITLTRNTSAMTNSLKNMVDIYNGMVTKIKEYTKYDTDAKKGGILQGDPTVTDLLSTVRAALVGSAEGFDSGTDAYTLPSQIGFHFDKDGVLSLDSTELNAALSQNYVGVLSLVGAQGTGVSSSTYMQLTSASTAAQPGSYEVEADFDAGGTLTAGRIRRVGETEWRGMALNGNTLLGADGKAEEGLLLTAVSDGTAGAHTQTATIRLRQGVAGAIYKSADGMLDATSGRIPLKKAQFDNQIKYTQDRIDTLQDRLNREEQRLRDQYARLETTLAKWDAQKAAFDALIQSVQANSSASSSKK
jgi:flagellar hook-associated protein 2